MILLIVMIKQRALAIHPIQCRTQCVVSGPKWGSPSGDVTIVVAGQITENLA